MTVSGYDSVSTIGFLYRYRQLSVRKLLTLRIIEYARDPTARAEFDDFYTMGGSEGALL